ncbi:MAG: hypothetical protein FWC00_03450 [Firmicutes bacterium]|nr:hypothetical protein [Bacillota bacterium]
MTYTPKHYEQDKRIALCIFNQHFKGHYLKDDLVHYAISELWKHRRRGNYLDYVASACAVAKKKMISYLRKETRHIGSSLFDQVDEDLQLIDLFAFEQPTADEYCDFAELVKKLMPLSTCYFGRDRKIISMHLKHYTQSDIALRVGVTQQQVSLVINKFRQLARQYLDN